MATGYLPSLDAFKLPTTFSTTGVVHSHSGNAGPHEVWTDISLLGHGGQGTVYLQQLQSAPEPLLRAVKVLSPDLRSGKTKRELNMMMAVRDHEDLFVTLFGWFEDPRGTLFLVMEYVPHGDLAAYIKTTPAESRDARGVAQQLLSGLSVLHSLHICHRDLKPQNVLLATLNPLKVKLADFGISKSTSGTDLRTHVGTANYMAPEQLGLLPSRMRMGVEYMTAVDMWGLGFIVYELLTGQTPFLETPVYSMSSGSPTVDTAATAGIDMRLMLQFCDGNMDLPRESLRNAYPAAVSFIVTLVVADPRARASAAQAMLHPWIIGRDSPPPPPEPRLARVPQARQTYLVGRLENPPAAPTEPGRMVMENDSSMDYKFIMPSGFPIDSGLTVAPSSEPLSYPAGVGSAALAGPSRSRPIRDCDSDSPEWDGRTRWPESSESSSMLELLNGEVPFPCSSSNIGEMDFGQLAPPSITNHMRHCRSLNVSTSGSVELSSIEPFVLPAEEPTEDVPFSISRFMTE